MARTPVTCSDYSTNTLEPLMHALYHLQRTPGCEEEAESIASKLREEFLSFPIKYDKNKQPYRLEEGIKYLPSGNILLPTYPGWTIAHIGGWDFEVEEPEAKAKKQKAVSFSFMRDINPIWYAQIQTRLKRRVSVKDEAVDIEKLFELIALHESLPKEEREMVEKVDHTINSRRNMLNNHVGRLPERIFKIQLNQGGWYRYTTGNPKHFFFLSELECDTIIEHVKLYGAPEKYYGYDAKPFLDMLTTIIDARPEGRYYILDIDMKEYQQVTVETATNWHGRQYTHEVVTRDNRGIYDYYLDQLQDCSNEQLKVLKYLGIEITKEDA